MSASENSAGALHVSLGLWHPDCWTIRTTEQFDVGFLGYGIYMTGEQVATLFTIYANEQETIENALEAVAVASPVYSVSEMNPTFRDKAVPKPGNSMRELLVIHDGRKQISRSLTSRGFVCAGPIDIRDGREYWTLVTKHDRKTVQTKLNEIREEKDAEINVRSIKRANQRTAANSLPVDQLTKRQLEVFQLARERGYYEYPKEVSAKDLADELEISTSTFHEHLHKVEAILLGKNGSFS